MSLDEIALFLTQFPPGALRAAYFTTNPMGKPGARGRMQVGDLSSDAYAKIVWFDRDTDSYMVSRGNVSTGDERVPRGEIVPIMRSFVRQAPMQRAYITIADSDTRTGEEKILRAVDTTKMDVRGASGGGVSNRTLLMVIVALVLVGAFVFYRKFGLNPGNLPSIQPFVFSR